MLIEAGENAWSLVLCDSLDMHIVQAWNTILQLFIIWMVGILFESGVDDGRTYRQVAGSWVCSWWVTAVGKVPTTLESGRLDTKSFQYKLKVRLHKNFDLFLVSKRPVNFYFFYVRFRSFSLVSSATPTTMRSHQSKGRAMADWVIIAWFARFTSVELALYLIIIPEIACIQSWASQALRTDNFSKLWWFLKQKKINIFNSHFIDS